MAEHGAARIFAGKPQPVEIHHRGIWYTGELIGWRHESDGRVVARVRCVVDKLRHSAWKDLADLRLPDPEHPPRREVAAPARLPSGAAPTGVPDEDDATRPHVLLAGMRARPEKPAHATTPPPRPRVPAGAAIRRPYADEALARPRVSTTPERRRTYLTTA